MRLYRRFLEQESIIFMHIALLELLRCTHVAKVIEFFFLTWNVYPQILTSLRGSSVELREEYGKCLGEVGAIDPGK